MFKCKLILFLASVLFAVTPVSVSAVAGEATDKVEFVTVSGPHSFTVEVAKTAKERERGLMNRREMAPDHGMLFLFDVELPVYMWMKNTFLPLDMIFVSKAGRVSGIARDAQPMSEKIISSNGPVWAVIELNAGAAKAMSLAVGDPVRHPGLAP